MTVAVRTLVTAAGPEVRASTYLVAVFVDLRVTVVVVSSPEGPVVHSTHVSVFVVTASAGVEEVDSQSPQVTVTVEVESSGLAGVVVVVQSTQGSPLLVDAGSTGLVVVVVDDSQSAHGYAALVVVAESTGFVVVVVDSQSAQGSAELLEVVAGLTGLVVVVVVVVVSQSPQATADVVVAASTGFFVVVVVVVAAAAVEFQSPQVSRATCSFWCMCLTWLEAETDPTTAAPAAAIVTALILNTFFFGLSFQISQCFWCRLPNISYAKV